MSVLRRLLRSRPELWLALACMVMYSPGLTWGLPSGTDRDRTATWGIDEIVPLESLSELRHLGAGETKRVHVNYPLFHYVLVGAAQAPYVLWLRMTGGLGQPDQKYPFGLTDPPRALEILTLIGRGVSLLMAGGLVLAAFWFGTACGDRVTGWIAAVCCALLYPMFYFATTANMEVPYTLWVTLALVSYVRMLRVGISAPEGARLGAFTALAVATKDQAVGMMAFVPIVLAFGVLRSGGPIPWRALAITAAATLLTYLAAAGVVVAPGRFMAHVELLLSPDGVQLPALPATPEGYAAVVAEVCRTTALSLGPVLTLVGSVAICIAVLRARDALWWGVPAIGLLAIVILPSRHVQLRYLFPVAVLLACGAAVALRAGLGSSRRWVRAVAAVALGATVVVGLYRGLRLTDAKLHDARYAAAAWLDAHTQPGDEIGFFGPSQKLPRVDPSVRFRRLVEFKGTVPNARVEPQRVRAMIAQVAVRPVDFVVVIPDHTIQTALPHGTTLPPDLYRALQDGSVGYERAARFRTRGVLARGAHWFDEFPLVGPPVEVFRRIAVRPRRMPADDERVATTPDGRTAHGPQATRPGG